jgi:hypothetical protein
MNWLFALLFPKSDTTVRIRSGHLPGLKAPTVAPKIPIQPKRVPGQKSNIQTIYERYKATRTTKPSKQADRERGVDFS